MDRIDAALNRDRIDILIELRGRHNENTQVKSYRKMISFVVFVLNLVLLIITCFIGFHWTEKIYNYNSTHCVNEYKANQILEYNSINITKNGGKT